MVIHHKEWYRMFSSALLHADLSHLIVNMLILLFFGYAVEERYEMLFGGLGDLFYAALYIISIPVSKIKTLLEHRDDPGYNALGASGAASAVLFAFILFQPLASLQLYFLIPIPAVIFGVAYLWYSSYMAKRKMDNIGHDVHFYGAIFGFVYTILLKPELALLFIEIVSNFSSNTL